MRGAYRVGLEAAVERRRRSAGGVVLLAIAIGLLTGVLANLLTPAVVVVAAP